MKGFRIGIVKLASCSGCINEVIYCISREPELLKRLELAYFTELNDSTELPRELDVVLVEGSVTSREHEELLKTLRSRTRILVALGTCATLGGVQGSISSTEHEAWETREPLPRSAPIRNVVRVDFEVFGCPVNGDALASYLRKLVMGGSEIEIHESLCAECKRLGIPCVVFTRRTPCLGPIVRAGCGAVCPRYGRGCYGCFGVKSFDVDETRVRKLVERYRSMGLDVDSLLELASKFNPMIRSVLGGHHERH